MISLIIPSSMREKRLDDLLANLLAHPVASAEYIVVFDHGRACDNPGPVIDVMTNYPEVRFIFSPEKGCWTATNLGLAVSRFNLICWTADDANPWPNALHRGILKFYEKFPGGGGLLVFNDLHHDGAVAGHCITTKRFLAAIFGKTVFPPFQHWYCDTLVADRARDLDRIHYAHDIIWEHMHWQQGKSERDKLNIANEVDEKRKQDKMLKDSLDAEWVKGGRALAASLLREA